MPSRQVDLDASARAGGPARNGALDDGTLEIASDVAYRRLAIVNVVFSGRPGARDRDRVLIDAGLFGTKALIRRRRGASVWSRLATLDHHSHWRAFRPCMREGVRSFADRRRRSRPLERTNSWFPVWRFVAGAGSAADARPARSGKALFPGR